jgi:hypothetical protein
VRSRRSSVGWPNLEARLDKLERTVDEGFAENRKLLDMVIKRSTEDRDIADRRHEALVARMGEQHAAVMAQIEKLATKPPEN